MNRLQISSRLMAAALMTAKRCGDSDFMSGHLLSGRTEKAVSVEVIELFRKKIAASQADVARQADISERTYRRACIDPDGATSKTIARAANAIRRIRSGQKLDSAQINEQIAGLYGAFMVAVSPHYRVTPSDVRATDPRAATTSNPHWLACAHVRQTAIYLVHVNFGISQRAIARTVGLTEAAVCLAVQSVEDRRDDIAFARVLDDASRDVTGRLTT